MPYNLCDSHLYARVIVSERLSPKVRVTYPLPSDRPQLLHVNFSFQRIHDPSTSTLKGMFGLVESLGEST